MESYEEFCLRRLAKLQSEGKNEMCCQWLAPSTICFHGRAVLSPLLSEKQREEMAEYKQRAAHLEAERQALHRSHLLTQAQNILDSAQVNSSQAQVRKVSDAPEPPASPACCSPKPESVNGFIPVPGILRLPNGGGIGEDVWNRDRPVTPLGEPPVLMNRREGVVGEREEEEEDREENDGNGMSLQSLLRRSREYVEREQGWRGSRGGSRGTVAGPTESLSDKENENSSPVGDQRHIPVQTLTQTQRHSPLSPVQTQTQNQTQSHSPVQTQNQNQTQHYSPLSPTQCQYQSQYQPGSDPTASHGSLLGGLPHTPTGSHPPSLRSPEPSLSPRPHRGRPRPVSTGNILLSFPLSSNELSAGGTGRSQGAIAVAMLGAAALPGSERRSLDCASSAGSAGSPGSSVGESHRGSSPVWEVTQVPASTSGPGPLGRDIMAAGFRRRCHTLDSQPYPSHQSTPVDRSQERLPRFMAGVPQRVPCRRSPPTPLSQSYGVESPVPSLLRPSGPPELDDGRGSPSYLSAQTEDNNTEDMQRRVQAMEEMQRRLDEEHAVQLSLLIAEQEREQQRLRQGLEEKERRLREQGCGRPVCGDAGLEWKVVSERYPTLSPSCPTLSPAETPPGHNALSMGFPSPLSPNVPSPSIQSPIYLWGPNWGASKSRGRMSKVITPEQQRALCHLSSIARGFLTRRLLNTDKVKHLRQTVQDTQEFIRSFHIEGPQKKGSLSAQDLSLQERVRAQLRAALFDIHDIFFEMPLEERLALLQQDRELRAERKLREMEKARSPKDRVALSAATQRSLDRKKQRVSESPGQTRRTQHKPKSPPTNRILQPSQGQNAPIPGQLLRQGSLYRKTPEERLKRSESLKKRNSLG